MATRDYYDDNDAEEILRIAARRDNPLGGVSRSELMKSASELGISPDAILEAEAQYYARKSEAEERKLFKKYQWNELFSHFGAYLAVCGFLAFLDLRHGHLTWSLWPIGIWGFILLSDSVGSFFGSNRERAFAKWKRKQLNRQQNPLTFDVQEDLEHIAKDLNLEKEKDRLKAIKELREKSGIDLREAREAVDEYQRVRG